jgi:hypothetical protein
MQKYQPQGTPSANIMTTAARVNKARNQAAALMNTHVIDVLNSYQNKFHYNSQQCLLLQYSVLKSNYTINKDSFPPTNCHFI